MTRHYTLQDATERSPVMVKVWAPKACNNDFVCRAIIDGLHVQSKELLIRGIDTMQASYLTLLVVSAELYGVGQPTGRHVYWHVPGDDLGLPVPDTIVDLVRGRLS